MPRTDPGSAGRTERTREATPLAVTHYDTLGVRTDASPAELRRAYLAKVARLDPDRAKGAPPEMAEALREATSVVDAAWAVVGDEQRRAEYDRELAAATNTRRAHAEHVWVMERELDWSLSPVFGVAPPEATRLSSPGAPPNPPMEQAGRPPLRRDWRAKSRSPRATASCRRSYRGWRRWRTGWGLTRGWVGRSRSPT